MSIRTAARHTAAELRYFACCDRTGIVIFDAPSQSEPGKLNTVSIDTMTGATHCDCRAATVGAYSCWHLDLVAEAVAQLPAVTRAAALADDQLLAAGTKAAALVARYRRVIGRALPQDVLALVATRLVWRERRAARAAALAPVLTFPGTVPVAA